VLSLSNFMLNASRSTSSESVWRTAKIACVARVSRYDRVQAMSTVFVVGSQEFDTDLCLRGLNLLGHAQMIELSVGSQCGGHGKCGKDRVLLQEADRLLVNEPTAIERIHLSSDELSRGVRLACQCFPNEDDLSLRVWVPSSKESSTPQA